MEEHIEANAHVAQAKQRLAYDEMPRAGDGQELRHALKNGKNGYLQHTNTSRSRVRST